MVHRKLLRRHGRFIPLFGPLTWISLAWAFWLVPGFPVNFETILTAGMAGLLSTWVSLKFWQGRHRMHEPVLVADREGLRLLPAVWSESVELKWQEIEEIFPYRSMGNEFLGIESMNERENAGSSWPRWLSEIQG